MATARDWAAPFLAQATDDLRAAQATYLSKVPSTFCMLMQMTFEKLAKAALARQRIQPPQSHQVASRLLLLLERTPGGTSLPGVSIALVFAAVRDLENAQPDVVSNAMRNHGVPQYPQLEYPWESPTSGAIEWPAQHLPIAHRIADPRDPIGPQLLKFAKALEAQFDNLFP
jgi:HEPN domain-containing protein